MCDGGGGGVHVKVYYKFTCIVHKLVCAYTSDLSVYTLSATVSGAIHLSGILSLRDDTYSGVSRERPKSDILSSFLSPTRMFRQAVEDTQESEVILGWWRNTKAFVSLHKVMHADQRPSNYMLLYAYHSL